MIIQLFYQSKTPREKASNSCEAECSKAFRARLFRLFNLELCYTLFSSLLSFVLSTQFYVVFQLTYIHDFSQFRIVCCSRILRSLRLRRGGAFYYFPLKDFSWFFRHRKHILSDFRGGGGMGLFWHQWWQMMSVDRTFPMVNFRGWYRCDNFCFHHFFRLFRHWCRWLSRYRCLSHRIHRCCRFRLLYRRGCFRFCFQNQRRARSACSGILLGSSQGGLRFDKCFCKRCR